ncbi:MAG: glycosyltransferase family 1 protein [Patescibacteria group bacterium]
MKIGIDARMYSSGFTGIGRYTFELLRGLAQLDDKTEFVVFLNPDEFKNFVAPGENFRAVAVHAPHYSVAEQTNFLKQLNAEKLDLMHFTHFNAPLFYHGKSVVTIHDLTLSKFPGKKMNKLIHRLAYNLVLRRAVSHARKIIAVSQNTKTDLMELLRVNSDKISVIWNGVGREFVPQFPTELSRRQLDKKFGIRQSYLLYTGVWRDHKNILGLLEAVAKMIEQHKDFDGAIVITGRPNPVYAPEIFAKVRELGLRERFVFTDLVEDKDLLQLYQNARVFVFPSFYEGFGLPPLEAMACGIPVAASNASSIPEICGEKNALFFDPRNVDEMAEKIWTAWSDEAVRKKLKEKGLSRVLDFSWKKMSEQTYAVYHEALGI